MALPLIGITSSRVRNKSGHPTFTVMEAYIQSVVHAGACPVIIPLGLPEAALEEMVTRLDGVLFTGGGDVHPSRYNGGDHDQVTEMDGDRDRVEIFLVEQAQRRSKPFLGICRGLQVINVAMGGSLYEDLLDQRPGSMRHQYSNVQPRDYHAHPVQVASGSRLIRILGAESVEVNSLHHQGIRDLATGLVATAFAPDGVVEAFEVPGDHFALAVQWHPEWLQEQDEMRNLFRAFVESTRKE